MGAVDIRAGGSDTGWMLGPGGSRERLARVLGAAFAEGLLSEQTLSHRLGLLFGPRLIETRGLVGDLALRPRSRRLKGPSFASAVAAARGVMATIAGGGRPQHAPVLLALDWSGVPDEVLIGRGSGCDVALCDDTVSRRHAQLVFRDGRWIVQDLGSRNGTTVNGRFVGRCQLRPGDRLGLGLQIVEID